MTILGYVLDDTVLVEVGRGDFDVRALMVIFNQSDTRTSVPAITLAVAEASLSPDQRRVVRGMIDALDNVELALVSTQDEAARLSEVVARMTPPADMAAAHAIAVSQYLDWPILTMSRKRWAPVVTELPWRIELVEIRDPE
ncbi:hypothetical protein [Nonomuraea sp. NPDC050310]|uniref:hypothetical protein n=1 Tax=Nonomuraea sp. NPDC050310 TaxID=3154935 RepID=UPI0033E72B06